MRYLIQLKKKVLKMKVKHNIYLGTVKTTVNPYNVGGTTLTSNVNCASNYASTNGNTNLN